VLPDILSIRESHEIQKYSALHNELCTQNVFLLPGVSPSSTVKGGGLINLGQIDDLMSLARWFPHYAQHPPMYNIFE